MPRDGKKRRAFSEDHQTNCKGRKANQVTVAGRMERQQKIRLAVKKEASLSVRWYHGPRREQRVELRKT